MLDYETKDATYKIYTASRRGKTSNLQNKL